MESHLETEPAKIPDRRIKLEDDKVIISFPYNSELVAAIKKIPSAKWDATNKVWRAILNKQSPEVLSFARTYGFTGLENFSFPPEPTIEDINLSQLNGELRTFQKEAVIYAHNKKSVLIADDMGLGKTVEALAIVADKGLYPTLIVCPAVVTASWIKHINNWLPNKSYYLVNSQKYEEADFYVMSYDRLVKLRKESKIPEFKSLVVDESHYIKGKSQRTQAILEVSEKSQNTILLTGTPIINTPADLVNPLRVMKQFDSFGNWTKFVIRYCNAVHNGYGWELNGSAHLDELTHKLSQTCYIRREKSLVAPEIPPKTRNIIPVSIDNKKEYYQAEAEIVTWLGQKARERKMFYASLAGLSPDEKELAEAQYNAEEAALRAETLVRITTLKGMVAKGKLQSAVEWIEDFLLTGESLVIFAYHKEIIQYLQEKFNTLVIDGSTNSESRARAQEDFQAGKNPLIVCSLKAAGIGITLTKASNELFLEIGWTAAEREQAEDRCVRIGQQYPVTINYILDETTIDKWSWELIENKQNMADQLKNIDSWLVNKE